MKYSCHQLIEPYVCPMERSLRPKSKNKSPQKRPRVGPRAALSLIVSHHRHLSALSLLSVSFELISLELDLSLEMGAFRVSLFSLPQSDSEFWQLFVDSRVYSVVMIVIWIAINWIRTGECIIGMNQFLFVEKGLIFMFVPCSKCDLYVLLWIDSIKFCFFDPLV